MLTIAMDYSTVVLTIDFVASNIQGAPKLPHNQHFAVQQEHTAGDSEEHLAADGEDDTRPRSI